MPHGGEGVSRRTLAQKLQYLYATAIPEGRGGRWTDRDVSAAAGGEISTGYLSELRTGVKTNPTMRHLELLAAVFGVPPAYFFPDDDVAAAVDAQRVRDAEEVEVRVLAVKARALSPTGRERIAEMIDYVAMLERNSGQTGQPQPEPPDPPARTTRQ